MKVTKKMKIPTYRNILNTCMVEAIKEKSYYVRVPICIVNDLMNVSGKMEMKNAEKFKILS